ncbi:IspD/TarI family cytidylyltransferase [Undibacterium fentianense]|uniref:2-C-methyl-D-erythritol 4-phosphate cytidylyltransferase n=1 Tax=Undibacterium fentianense TaxID=2828728 RepID=A0A941IDZ8_9BURK|nr:2-C-methyl-D-erythritol 4-phosphate cytidylyltransferase [Undibacterium fentianense]MBR7799111.1 2-C-methyl-D-erythritol 4-phosphate cytidylyltransferase [Undibacterium fentianense]
MTHNLIADLSILIPACGIGERLGRGPKALLEIDGETLLRHLSRKALSISSEVVIAAPLRFVEQWRNEYPDCRVVAGGDTHLLSMRELVMASTRQFLINLNVAMPMMSRQLIRSVYEAACLHGVAAAYMPPDLPVAEIRNGKITRILSRHISGILQGPNAYQRGLFLKMMGQMNAQDWECQSFLEIASKQGIQIATVMGERENIKITTETDWQRAQILKDYLQ